MAVSRVSEALFKIAVVGSVVATLKDQIYIGRKRKMLVWVQTLNAAGVQQLDVKIHRVRPEPTNPPAADEKVQLGATLTAAGNANTSGVFGEGAAVPPEQFISDNIEVEQIRSVVGTLDYNIWIELRE